MGTTIMWSARPTLYPTPAGMAERQDYFRQNAPTTWLGNETMEAAFRAIYGIAALENAKTFWSVPENRDRAFVFAPQYAVEIQAADPGGELPSDQTLAQIKDELVLHRDVLKKILSGVQDLQDNPRVNP